MSGLIVTIHWLPERIGVFVTSCHWMGGNKVATEYNSNPAALAGQAREMPFAPVDAIPRITDGGGSTVPGEPPRSLEGRQFWGVPHALVGAKGSTTTSEKPSPSVIGYQAGS